MDKQWEIDGEALTGLAFRLLCLTTKYSKPLDYTHDKLEGCKKVLRKWLSKAERTSDDITVEFLEAICDDMNTPKALAIMHAHHARKQYGMLFASMNFLGLIPNSHPHNYRDMEQKDSIENILNPSNPSRPSSCDIRAAI